MTYRNLALIFAAAMVLSGCGEDDSREIGEVDTAFKLFGPNHKVITKSFEDPKIKGVHCFVSASETGGFWGALGLAEDTSDASIDCVQTGPVTFAAPLEKTERVFEENRSLFFKELRVARSFDPVTNTAVYIAYSTRLISGSPQNSVSAVPITAWPNNNNAPKPEMKK